jgi:hypothetical protein
MKLPLHPIILSELERCGRAWRLEHGTRHDRIFIDDAFVTIVPRGGHAGGTKSSTRQLLNSRGHIRRFLRGLV